MSYQPKEALQCCEDIQPNRWLELHAGTTGKLTLIAFSGVPFSACSFLVSESGAWNDSRVF